MRKKRTFVCDFETTVYEGQESTEVWASALVEMFTNNVIVHHSINDTFKYISNLNCDVVLYYHNLKFDGQFWLSFLFNNLRFTQAINDNYEWIVNKKMNNNSFKYIISDNGQWYMITIKVNDCVIEIRDSLKLLPFSVKVLGESFNTKHRKTTIEYKGVRYAGCYISPEEKEYIANDVLVVKESLEVLYSEGHNKLTIGSCCLSEFKMLTGDEYNMLFPDLSKVDLDKTMYGSDTVDGYIRKSYHGGWCYLVKGKENQIKNNGITLDVNSLYPSMMHSESGNYYPYGYPTFWKGRKAPKCILDNDKYYFIRIKTAFKIRDGYLPFIQIKNSLVYRSNESLSTSDIYDKNTDRYYKRYRINGVEFDNRVTLTLTKTDFELMQEHYILEDLEVLDGCYFNSVLGAFDDYINKYKKKKIESKGALRTLAKLFLNNLYGKLASNPNNSYKVAYVEDDGVISFKSIFSKDKECGYIPCGSAITSYARNFTIRTAQANYYGVFNRGFIYADTDSIHCDLDLSDVKGVKIHDKDFCCWKEECVWDYGIFARQKTYIEHVINEDGINLEQPYYNIKCAGMPPKAKQMLTYSIEGYNEELDLSGFTQEQIEFIKKKRELSDFKTGLTIPDGKLIPKLINGGVILVDTSYTMK